MISDSDPSQRAMSDKATTIAELKQVMQRFVEEREWQRFHNPKSLSMSLAIEVGELMEHFQWITNDESVAVRDDRDRVTEIAHEVADCLSYLLSIANALNIDLADAMRRKMVLNREKYPVGKPFDPTI